MKAVNAGEIPAGVIYHYYWFGDQAKTGENSKNVELHYFKNEDPGAFVSVSGGGVLKSSKNPAAAQAFLEFITGVDGQTILQTGDVVRVRDRQRRRRQPGARRRSSSSRRRPSTRRRSTASRSPT